MPPRRRATTNVRFMALRRPPWRAVAGDRWTEVSNVSEAVRRAGARAAARLCRARPQRTCAVSRRAAAHYLVRSVDPVDPPLPLPHVTYVTARGPFSEARGSRADGRAWHRVVIAKNSGGSAAYGKIAAARALGDRGHNVAPAGRRPMVRRSKRWMTRSRGSIMRSPLPRRAACKRAASGPAARSRGFRVCRR